MACNAVLGIEEPIERAASSGSSSGGGLGALPQCDPGEQPEPEALFVDGTSGVDKDDAAAGSREAPLLTIARALQLARAPRPRHIYLREGAYPENVVLEPDNDGVIIEGGWVGSDGRWSRDCERGAVDRTIIQGTAATNIALRATGVHAPTALRYLTIKTRQHVAAPSGQPGESLIGLFVEGTDAALSLEAVRVIAANAGSGGPVDAMLAPEGSRQCDGINDCCSSSDVGCTESGPASPPAAAPGSPGARGQFTPSGFTPGSGGPGNVGSEGSNGYPGLPSTLSGQCLLGTCGVCSASRCSSGNPGAPTHVPGPTGKCGCGGLGGHGGQGGPGGGASVALFITAGAKVMAAGTVLEAGAGGDGAPGQDGGPGGTPTPPKPTEPTPCPQHCSNVCSSLGDCVDVRSEIPAGADGSPGAQGASGGPGGSGAGGPSIAVLTSDRGEFIELVKNSLVPGKAGQGAPGAPDGESTTRLNMP